MSSDRAGSATTSCSDLPRSCRSPLYSAATRAARFPHWRMASASRISFLRMRRASSVRSSAWGCATAQERPGGNGKLYDVQRLVAPDQHESAQEGGGDVVSMRRAAGGPLGLHGERQELARRKRAPGKEVGPEDGGYGACRGASQPRAQGHPFFQRDLDAEREPDLREIAVHGNGGRVLLRVPGKLAPVSRDGDHRDGLARSRADRLTASPGFSSAKPSTSKPEATLATVAGAKTLMRESSGISGPCARPGRRARRGTRRGSCAAPGRDPFLR